MPEPARVEMVFDDGGKIAAWTELRLHESFEDPLGSLEFTVAPTEDRDDYRQRLAKGQRVKVLVNGADQGRYLIQSRKIAVTKQGGVVYSCTCQTELITPYQGSVDPHLSIAAQSDIPLTSALLEVFEPYGFTEIFGDQNASVFARSGKPISGRAATVTLPTVTAKEWAAQDNETAYGTASRWARRHGLCVRMNVDGTIAVCKPNYEGGALYTVVQSFTPKRPPGDLFLSVSVEDTNDDQFSNVILRGEGQHKPGTTLAARPKAELTSAALGISRPPYSSTVAPYKPKIFKDKNARDAGQAMNSARSALGVRAAKAYRVSGDVAGFVSSTGRIWSVDTLCRVYVEADNVDETMWILERTLMQSRQGQTTSLTLIPKNALQIGEQ